MEWRFLPDVADEAAEYVFHPKQQAGRLADGSLLVRFRAGGRQEMEWYLARWGDKVEVRVSDENTRGHVRIWLVQPSHSANLCNRSRV